MRSIWLYRLLLKLYPAGFRENYAGPLEREFRDERAEAGGAAELARLWVRTAVDLLLSAPPQMIREFGEDARHALRLWRRRPAHTVFAIAALAAGIGASTGVFSVVDALLIRSLPFREPERLVSLPLFRLAVDVESPAQFHSWRRHSNYLADTARYNTSEVNLGAVRESARVRITETSANFFSLLGCRPWRGRMFAADEDTVGRDAVAVIGYGLWQTLFGGDPSALGATIRVNGAPFTVIGVAPPGFDYPQRTALWSPTTFDWRRIPKSGGIFLEFLGRRRSGLSWPQAREAFEAEVRRLPQGSIDTDPANRPKLTPLQDQLAGPVKKASFVLMGWVALLLLTACANVANLLLARIVDRSEELSIRSALGASRARLVQQFLTESVLLSAVAAGAGMIVAAWAAKIANAVQPAPLAGQKYTVLDWRVLGFAVITALVTGVAFGILPALYAGGSKASPMFVRPSGSGRGGTRARHALIAVQIALTVILFTCSMRLSGAFLALMGVDNGYQVRNLATLTVSLAGTEYDDNGSRAMAYYEQALRRVQSVPGMVSASATEYLPLDAQKFIGGEFRLDGRSSGTIALMLPVAPGFFATMGSRVLYAREFEDADARSTEPLAVVNEAFARRFGDPGRAVGRYLTGEDWWGKASRVVGVVRDIRYMGPTANAIPQVFRLTRAPQHLTIVARVRGDARQRLAAIRDAIRSVDSRVPVFNVKTMSERLDEALGRPRFYATAMAFLSGFALLLAVVGVYGVISWSVLQRRREIGIRLALGTTPVRLRRRLLGRAMIPVACGTSVGIAGAVAAGRFLQLLIEGASASGPDPFVIAVSVPVAVAMAAIWLGTCRIARLDITTIVRAE